MHPLLPAVLNRHGPEQPADHQREQQRIDCIRQAKGQPDVAGKPIKQDRRKRGAVPLARCHVEPVRDQQRLFAPHAEGMVEQLGGVVVKDVLMPQIQSRPQQELHHCGQHEDDQRQIHFTLFDSRAKLGVHIFFLSLGGTYGLS